MSLKPNQKVTFKTTGRGGVESAGQTGKFLRVEGRWTVIARENGTEVKVHPCNVSAA